MPANKEQMLKELLESSLNSMKSKPSLITKVSGLWGKTPLWKKVIGGTALTVPAFVLGVPLTMCSLTAAIYVGIGFILEDHYKSEIQMKDNMSKGILSLADFLVTTITALEETNEKLSHEVGQFKDENLGLKTNISLLQQRIEEISKVRAELSASLEQAQTLVEVLNSTLTTISSRSLSSLGPEKPDEFNAKLKAFLEDPKASFDTILERFGRAEKQLEILQAVSKANNDRYESLLKKQELQIERLQKVADKELGLQKLGMFPKPVLLKRSQTTDLQKRLAF